MKKLFSFLLLPILIACNSGEEKVRVESATDSSKTENADYPYDINYSAKFEIGKTEHVQSVLALWKDFDAGTLSNSKHLFADTVTFLLDGTTLHGPKDSIIASIQAYRDMFSEVKSSIDAVVALRSTDKNEDWVNIWAMEKHVPKKGAPDSIGIQEAWRFNKDGRIDMMLQYVRKFPASK